MGFLWIEIFEKVYFAKYDTGVLWQDQKWKQFTGCPESLSHINGVVGGPSWYMRRISGQWIMVICGGGLWLVPLSTPSAIYLWKKKPFNPWNSYEGGRKCSRSGCSFRAFNHLLSTIEQKKRKQIFCQQCSVWIIFTVAVKVLGDHETSFLT